MWTPSYEPNSEYKAIQSELQRQTSALFAERAQLEAASPQFLPSRITNAPQDKTTSLKGSRRIIQKIHEVITLCQDDSSLAKKDIHQVIRRETEILQHLEALQRNRSKENVSHQLVTYGAERENQQSFKKKTQKPGKSGLSDETLEIIEEIQRKALNEILRLKEENAVWQEQVIKLQASLREFGYSAANNPIEGRIREENQFLKQENNELRNRFEHLSQGGIGQEQYTLQLNVYENQLRRASEIIRSLKQTIAKSAQVDDLHHQGEVIRQETVQLIKMRDSGTSPMKASNNQQALYDLQQRTEEESRQKQIFLNDLAIFKQKYKELELENQRLKRGSKGTEYTQSPKVSSPHKIGQSRPLQNRYSALSQYEKTINDMKKVMAY